MNVDYLTDVYFTYDEDFPIFLVKNFIVVDSDYKEKLKNIILDNMNNHYNIKNLKGYNFALSKDYNDFYLNTYYKFYDLCDKIFGKLNPTEDCIGCHAYITDSSGFGVGKIHNHLQTSTISACYYFNIPKDSILDEGSISFISWNQRKELLYRPSTFDLIIFPNYLDHKINYSPHEEKRITITMEIQCEEDSNELFNIPFEENLEEKNAKSLFKYYKKILF